MAYCELTDIQGMVQLPTLCQLTVDVGDADYIDETRLLMMEEKAANFIDGYLRGRFTLPLTIATVPVMIKDIAISLTIYFLYQRSVILTMPETVKWNYLEAKRLLLEIQKGNINPFESAQEPEYTKAATDSSVDEATLIDKTTWYGYKYKV